MILVDRVWRGQMRKLLLHADRNGFFYVLDRTNGKFLQATNFVHQTWNRGFDANGRPIMVPNSNSMPDGSILVYPTLNGGTNFQAPSYSAATGLFYLEYAEGGAQFTSGPAEFAKPQHIGRPPAAAAPMPRGPARRQRSIRNSKTVGLQDVPGCSRTAAATAGNVVIASTATSRVSTRRRGCCGASRPAPPSSRRR